MELQKLINSLEITTNQTHKYRTKTWVKINDNTKSVVMMLLIKPYLKLQC